MVSVCLKGIDIYKILQEQYCYCSNNIY